MGDKENYDRLFWILFKLFIFIWLASTVVFVFFCYFYNVRGTEGSIGAYMNLLVFDATIFAPIAAYFFYDNWKEQNSLIKLAEVSYESIIICNELSSNLIAIRISYNNSLFSIFRITMATNPFKKEFQKIDKNKESLLINLRFISGLSGNPITLEKYKSIRKNIFLIEYCINEIKRKNWSYEKNRLEVKKLTEETRKLIKELEEVLFLYTKYNPPAPLRKQG